jgi:hypothetical protein
MLVSFTLQTIAEVKTNVIEGRLKDNFSKAGPFLQKAGQLMASLGLTDQAVLRAIPAIEVVISNLQGLQEDFDRLRSAYYDNDADIVFNKVIRNGLDPERVMSKRSSHLIHEANATLSNQYRG